VDTETGFVQVTRLISATDAGKAINPMGVEGQVQGGAAMGLGYALYEQHIVDGGRPKTASLAFYLVPTPLDVPEIECLIVEVPDPNGPYGAKGVSEPATIPTTPAFSTPSTTPSCPREGHAGDAGRMYPPPRAGAP
jgi:CO/xanthine dehydrogenase Mo-binding subunit